MSKEYLEALKKVKYNSSKEVVEAFDVIEKGLQRLESIDNAKPSEALEKLENLGTHGIEYREGFELGFTKSMPFKSTKEFKIIKQALLKAQENEKENELLKEIIKSLFDRGCPLHQYIGSKGVLQIEVDDECSNMRLGEYKGVDLDKKLKEVLG